MYPLDGYVTPSPPFVDRSARLSACFESRCRWRHCPNEPYLGIRLPGKGELRSGTRAQEDLDFNDGGSREKVGWSNVMSF